jgi:membrane protease YdiL (CAAX protease family)
VTRDLLRRRPLLGFYLLAYAFTWAIGVPLMLSKRGLVDVALPHFGEPLAAFGPFAAAVIVLRAVRGPAGARELFASLGRWRVGAGGLALALLSTPALLLLALVGASLGGAAPTDEARRAELWTMMGAFDLVVVGGLLQSIGEEPGWRGLAVPTLRERFGPLLATLALWPVWLCWHLPFFLSRPAFGWPQWAGFSLGILSAAIWLTLIRDRTRSLAMCVGWHALANICRNTALALSSAVFLAYNNLVLLSALAIAGYWAWQGRSQAGPQGGA